MLPLAGYADRLSARPGETLRFHVANATDAAVTAKIVRVISADPNPAGPGIQIVPVTTNGQPAHVSELATPALQTPPQGSYAQVPAAPLLSQLTSFTFLVTLWPTRPVARCQTIATWHDAARATGLSLALSETGCLTLDVGQGDGRNESLQTPCRVDDHTWSHVLCTYDAATQEIEVGVFAPRAEDGHSWKARLDHPLQHGRPDCVFFAGTPNARANTCYNGKIERPQFLSCVLGQEGVFRAGRGETVPGLVAAWDFSRDMHTTRIVDTGPHGLHGTLVNTPTRAVRGATWTGREQCFRHAPEQYAAIHFHDDDIDDCRWPATHEFKIPADLRSGAYALLLEAGDARENIPFFVVPPKGTQTAKLAVLVSTFTYTVYGNHARPEWTADPKWRDAWISQAKDWNAYPHNPGAHTEYGLSTYNYHSDGSGIAMASWRRPMLNLRIGYLTYPYPEIRASGLRHYPADSHLLAWLEHAGVAYDLITDFELHHEGLDLLKRYTCVTTGSHPEYHTGAMLDALEAYRDGGGRFMYLGGNGFYWKIALSPEQDGLIEIRRAEGGIRAWAAEPGEYYNQFDGEYGGLWRRNGRPPQTLVGVGFTAQGNFVGSHYRIDAAARTNPRTAWMFDGIPEATIGGDGLSGHGAAGFELDRADKRLGTPAHAVVVAQSEDHPPEAPWVLVPEEQLTHITTIPGQSHRQLIRADMTLFETPNNGCVFSTGSITFCGSLPHNGFDNPIARLLRNVLTRFLDPTAKFPRP